MQAMPSGGAGPGLQAGTPGHSGGPAPPGLGIFGDPNKLIQQMPELLKMRQAGQMNPEMQKTVSGGKR
jgi:hypothetical protein